ncbi:DUF6427 family protein [Nonlabens antarcticus]|uniref:DUF6427 family protein n=1 Tax=Nonlabens antarcticus TaxID=392714 RepID=UPI0018910E5E|nr:DUF6427 family protein [Nonlabens antarcticus]
MLSRFFSTSQPFHYLVGILLLGPVSIGLLVLLNGSWEWKFLIIGCLLPLALLLVQFIILKNELTGQNSYGLFSYATLTLCAVILGIQWEFAVCLLLLLFALRRLLSLKTGTSTIRKIFDGTLWIAIASLIQPPMIVFILVVFSAVFLFDRTKWRHWVIPFVALICVAVLSFLVEVFMNYEILSALFYREAYPASGMLEQWKTSDLIGWILCVFAVIGFVIYVIKLVDIQQRVRPRFSVLTISGICATLLALFVNEQFVIVLIPVLAIFQARAMEHIHHKGFREFIFLVPVFLLVIAVFTR